MCNDGSVMFDNVRFGILRSVMEKRNKRKERKKLTLTFLFRKYYTLYNENNFEKRCSHMLEYMTVLLGLIGILIWAKIIGTIILSVVKTGKQIKRVTKS